MLEAEDWGVLAWMVRLASGVVDWGHWMPTRHFSSCAHINESCRQIKCVCPSACDEGWVVEECKVAESRAPKIAPVFPLAAAPVPCGVSPIAIEMSTLAARPLAPHR